LHFVESGFETVGRQIEAVRLRAGLAEAMRLAREVNGYLDRAPWFGVIESDRGAAATTVYTALRAIDSLKVMLSPFLPFSSQQLHRALGYADALFGEQRIETYEEQTRSHQALVYAAEGAAGRWEPSRLPVGQQLAKPAPLYKKLDDELVEAERARLGAASEE
jgi:methionyl-tRNA synthetase